MKLGIQGWFLAQPHTGIGQHCLGLLRELALDSRLSVVVPVPMLMVHKGIPKHWLKVLPPKWWLLHPALKKWYWERVQVPAFFAEANPNWELYPYPCPLPRFSSNLRAMTVHDTILWDDPRYRKGRLKRHYHRAAARALVDVDQLFCVSESTRKALNIPAAVILPNAVELPSKLPPTQYENDLIYLGGYDLRKQVPALVEAFKTVRREYPTMRLLLIGEPHHHSAYYPEVPEVEGVERLGALTDRQVYSALSSAFALVHFSDSEGFNLPVLQAMVVGAPVIARDIPVNREVSGGTAVFLKKPSGKNLLDAVNYVKKHRKRIVGAQREAAQKYSWRNSVEILFNSLK